MAPWYVLLVGCLCVLGSAASSVHYNLIEEAPPGTVIGNIGMDSGILSEDTAHRSALHFIFLGDTPAKRFFAINNRTGEMTTTLIPLDREELCPGRDRCTLTFDLATRPADYFVSVTVDIDDSNDNTPGFPSRIIEFSLSEEKRPGYFYLLDSASDLDSPANGVDHYILSSESKAFSLVAKKYDDGMWNLRLALTRGLDREATPVHSLVLMAVDGGSPALTGSTTIRVHVVDANDNTPVFERSVYHANIQEDAEVGYSVVKVRATDRDTGDNARLRYSIVPAPDSSLFSLDPNTGVLILNAELDYDTRRVHRLGVEVQDSGSAVLSATAVVHVTVIDVNDNTPRISVLSETVSVAEHSPPQTFVAHISVVDADDPADNGAVSCSLTSGSNTFNLEQLLESDFKLVSVSELDRETQASYSVTVTCRDGGEPSRSSEADIDVTVTDVNDNMPVFTLNTYEVTLQENDGVGRYVLTMSATDADSGPNGEVRYHTTSERFHVDAVSGLVTTLVSFDREVEERVVMTVVATDSGEEPQSSSVIVTIFIEDVDDEPAVFSHDTYAFQVPEDAVVGTLVGRVQVSDADSPRYTTTSLGLQSPSTVFSLGPTSGEIRVAGALDRETRSEYMLVVAAPGGARARLHIAVTDINDNSPLVIAPTNINNTVSVSNRASVGLVVTSVTATDPDAGVNGTLAYQIVNGNHHGEFTIDKRSGDLIVDKDLSEHVSDVFLLVVAVSDGGRPSRVTTATLNVVVNKLLAAGGSTVRRSPLSGNGVVILVSVVCGTIVIVLALVMLLCFIKRRKRIKWPANAVRFPTVLEAPPGGKALDELSGSSTSSDRQDDTHLTDDHYSVKDLNDTQEAGELAMMFNTDSAAYRNKVCDLANQDTDSGCCADASHMESHNDVSPLDMYIANLQTVVPKRPSLVSRPASERQTDRTPATMPRRLDSFSDWVKNENYQLRQSGHVYRVSEQPQPARRKSVRFNEPEATPTTTESTPPAPPTDKGGVQVDGAYVSFEKPPGRRADGSLV